MSKCQNPQRLWTYSESRSYNIKTLPPLNVKEFVKTIKCPQAKQETKTVVDSERGKPTREISKCGTRDQNGLTLSKIMIKPQPKFIKNSNKIIKSTQAQYNLTATQKQNHNIYPKKVRSGYFFLVLWQRVQHSHFWFY